MEPFFWPVLGGTLIGFAAILLMLSLGKIAGISGIIWNALLFRVDNDNRFWRWAFLIGIVSGTLIFHWASGKAIPIVNDAPFTAAVAGLLVGIGVNVGNGCTSGHGVCGISRFSLRSLVATVTFMVAAIITVAISQQGV